MASAPPQFFCANWHPDRADGDGCQKYGLLTCSDCRLVVVCSPHQTRETPKPTANKPCKADFSPNPQYCRKECQKIHWKRHKWDCRCDQIKAGWQPSWIKEDRMPAFVTNGIGLTLRDGKYLWSTVPAHDVLKLESHEGVDREEGVKILFAGCIDLGNMVKTMAELPVGYKHPIKITISELDFDVVARNLLLLLVALVVEDIDEAVDCMIHLWYSAHIRESDLEILHKRIRPMITDILDKIEHKDPDLLLRKTWTFGERTLACTLKARYWARLWRYLKLPTWFKSGRGPAIRREVTVARDRRDFLDKELIFLQPSQRVAYLQFRNDGLLLPFGFSRHDFHVPNPTLYSDGESWPLGDDADPRHAWPAEEVAKTYSGPATGDMYGRLFYYLRGVFRKFLERASTSKLSLNLMHEVETELKVRLKDELYDRIVTPDISYLTAGGHDLPVGHLVPCLQPSSVNPHATLITLLAHAIDQGFIGTDMEAYHTANNPITELLHNYLEVGGDPDATFSVPVIRWHHARNILSNYDIPFREYCSTSRLYESRERVGWNLQLSNSIIEFRPYCLKLNPGEPEAQAEFDRLLMSGVTGRERYLEFKRTSTETPQAAT
ncbi:hypothetical protein HJFPF1_05120 [Paramyrothecium foliicola]|nr:hypothetical protein HJFPF1_05120 [Paramyrothecium foliicola]